METHLRVRDRLCTVQFMHPGEEHTPLTGTRWNTGPHKRKFVRSLGRYIADGDPVQSDVVFWGEWEAESEILAGIDNPLPEGPRFIYRPFWMRPTSYRVQRLQNTDPFVFGDRFFYTGCQQYTKRGPTILRHLGRGSVILFGSCRHRQFRLDTVFVVSHWTDHDLTTFRDVLGSVVSDTYKAVTISPIYRREFGENTPVRTDRSRTDIRSLRLYYGASYDDQVDGMFSFFPCLPFADDTRGFERPTVHLDGIVTDNLMQGKKAICLAAVSEVRQQWLRATYQVRANGLCLGINAELPPRQNS